MRKKIFSVCFTDNNDKFNGFKKVYVGALNDDMACDIVMNRFNILKKQIRMVSWSATKEVV